MSCCIGTHVPFLLPALAFAAAPEVISDAIPRTQVGDLTHEVCVNGLHPSIPATLPEELQACLRRCFSVKPEDRPSPAELK